MRHRPFALSLTVMDDLTGRVAVVTGGASGIGFALGERFAADGMNIVLADIEPEPLDAAVKRLRQSTEVLGVVTDVSERASVERLAEKTLAHFGGAHIICNNAGVGPGGVTWSVPASVWDWVIGVNLMGVVNGIAAFVPHLVKQDEGHVVNTASVAGLVGMPGMGAYSATKHAVIGLSQVLDLDLRLAGSNVGVTVLCPGATRTRMNESGRNWPARLGPVPPTGLLPGHPTVTDEFLENFPNIAIEPSDVAGQVSDAVRERRFWLLTERDDPTEWLESHYRGILSGKLPAGRHS